MSELSEQDRELEVYVYVKQHKDEILAERDAGDTTARNIVSVYNMCVRHADHASVAILESLVETWQEKHKLSS